MPPGCMQRDRMTISARIAGLPDANARHACARVAICTTACSVRHVSLLMSVECLHSLPWPWEMVHFIVPIM